MSGKQKKKLTPREKRFIEEYPIDLNGSEAYVRAGYSPNGANAGAARLLARVSIREAIDKRLAERARKTEISQEWVIQGLVDNLRLGAQVGQPGAVNRTYELLGKHLDMFKDKHEITGKDGAPLIPVLNVTRGKS